MRVVEFSGFIDTFYEVLKHDNRKINNDKKGFTYIWQRPL
jgi:hypothetical protein